MKNYIRQWTLQRLLRLIIGMVVVTQGVVSEVWMIAVLGGVFAVMALFNVSACATGRCAVPSRQPSSRPNDSR